MIKSAHTIKWLVAVFMTGGIFMLSAPIVHAADCSAPINDGEALMAWCSDALSAHYQKREQTVRTMSQQAHGTQAQWVVIGAAQVDDSYAVTYQCLVDVGKTTKDAEMQLVDPDEVWDPSEPIVIRGSDVGCD